MSRGPSYRNYGIVGRVLSILSLISGISFLGFGIGLAFLGLLLGSIIGLVSLIANGVLSFTCAIPLVGCKTVNLGAPQAGIYYQSVFFVIFGVLLTLLGFFIYLNFSAGKLTGLFVGAMAFFVIGLILLAGIPSIPPGVSTTTVSGSVSTNGFGTSPTLVTFSSDGQSYQVKPSNGMYSIKVPSNHVYSVTIAGVFGFIPSGTCFAGDLSVGYVSIIANVSC